MSESDIGQYARGVARRLAHSARSLRVGSKFESRVTWMLGSPRSGSTWLLRLLSEHPRICPVNEPLIGYNLAPFLCDSPGFDARLLGPDDFTMRRIRRDSEDEFFSERYRSVWQPALGELLCKRLHAQLLRHSGARSVGRSLLVVKEPNGSQSADLLMSAMPDSRLLFLLRDPRDVIDSELSGNMPGAWVSKTFPGARGLTRSERVGFATQAAHKWLMRTELVQEAYRSHRGAKLTVRYEAVRKEPLTSMRGIFDWLGASVAEGELGRWIDRHSFERQPRQASGPQEYARAANPGGWRSNLGPGEQDAIVDVLGPKLRELGYES